LATTETNKDNFSAERNFIAISKSHSPHNLYRRIYTTTFLWQFWDW